MIKCNLSFNHFFNSIIESKNSGKRWMEKARLIDAKGSVQDIAFAPNFMGLRLVSYFYI